MPLFKLKNEDIICYMEQEYGKYKLAGIALEREPDKVYINGYFSGMDELNYCYISDFLGKKLKKTIAAQLEAYINAHSGRYDFYKILNEGGKNRFYASNISILDYAIPEPQFSFNCDELINGIVSTQINYQTFQYNFRTNEVKADLPLFYMLYKDRLEMIVAKEQIRLGIAPQAFTELYNFQEALKDKQTVSVVFKDGETATIRRNNFNISDIYSFTVEEDRISYAFNTYNISYYGNNGVDDVDYLKLGKVKYQFNGDSLTKLHEPATADYAWRAA